MALVVIGDRPDTSVFLKLLAKVLMMVLNNNRHIYYVYGVLSGERAAAKPIGDVNWEQRINERLGLVLSEPETYLDSATDALQEILDGPDLVFAEFTQSEYRLPKRW